MMLASSISSETIINAFIGLLALAVTWLFKQVIQHGNDVTGLKKDVDHFNLTLKLHLEIMAKGAAKTLDSPNPTPEYIRVLLRKFYDDRRPDLNELEERELRKWAESLLNDPQADKEEKGLALLLYSGLTTIKRMDSHAEHR
jgi:LAS superfamily LD-carboxypeptidase LdcB